MEGGREGGSGEGEGGREGGEIALDLTRSLMGGKALRGGSMETNICRWVWFDDPMLSNEGAELLYPNRSLGTSRANVPSIYDLIPNFIVGTDMTCKSSSVSQVCDVGTGPCHASLHRLFNKLKALKCKSSAHRMCARTYIHMFF